MVLTLAIVVNLKSVFLKSGPVNHLASSYIRKLHTQRIMGWLFNGKCRSKTRLDGKTAIITGCNTGIGKITARDFAKRGARVIMACRDLVKAEEAAQHIKEELKNEQNVGELIVKKLDLSSFKSVREFSKEMLETEQQINLLINNAGVMMCPRSLTEDGFELHFATNHLGHFLLTMLLLPVILKSTPARIVNVSSKIHILARSLHLDDINLEKSYSPTLAYSRSKLANILFSKELARRLKGTGVNVYCLHPGIVNTDLPRHVDSAFFSGSQWIYQNLGWWLMKNPEQGAQTTIYCSVDEKTESETGLYYDDCKAVRPTSIACNEALAKELWDKTVEFVQLGSYDPFKELESNKS